MIYCLVNNTYHVTDFKSMFGEVITEDITFLVVPVNIIVDHLTDYEYIEFPSISIKAIKKTANDLFIIKRELKTLSKKISQQDTLLVFSEINLTNQIIIENFQKLGCRMLLAEDGMASPILFKNIVTTNGVKQWLIKTYIRIFIGLSSTRINYIKSAFFYFSPDHYFDAFIQTHNYPIDRKIKQLLRPIQKEKVFGIKSENNVVFFNQPLYLFYTSENEYYTALGQIVVTLSNTYDTIYLKLHPNETIKDIEKVKESCKGLKNLVILEKELTRTDFLSLNISHGISFLSSALKEYEVYGLVPIYIYHLYPSLLTPDLTEKLNEYLNNLGYLFIKDLEALSNIKEIKRPSEMYKNTSNVHIEKFNLSMLHNA